MRTSIPTTFDSLVSWLEMFPWEEIHRLAMQNGGAMSGSDFIEACPVVAPPADTEKGPHNFFIHPLRALKREYDR
jgi:hypothetical protein